MFHAPVDISHVGECPTHRRVFHGDAPSRGRHCLWGPNNLGNPNNPNNPNNLSLSNNPSNPNSLSNPGSLSSSSNPSDLSKLGGRRDFSNPSSPSALINGSDYSSEASSFIPSSIRDLSRNEKLSLIVLRWLPSG